MAGKFKHEDVAAVPRGYRVRTVRRGEHEIRVAFPPGPRRRGRGRVVSILHPVGENPNCPIRHIADRIANPGECKCGSGEPAVFGGLCARCAREKAREARERAGQIRGARINPSLVDEIRPGDKVTILTPHGSKLTGRAVMRSSTGGWVLNLGGRHGTPGLADERNIVKVRKGNPPTRMQVFFDPGIKKFTAVLYHPQFGNLYGSGFTKKQAAAALHERVREARRAGTHRNPRELTVPEKHQLKIARDTLRMSAAMAGVMGGMTKTQAREIVRRLTRKNPDELPEAEDLYREFHGREPREILEIQESDLARKEYTALGNAVELHFILPNGAKAKIEFGDADAVKVVSSPNGRQLYLLDGNQDISESLGRMGVDVSKDLIDLGDAVFLSYDASKWQTDFKPTIWEHKLGEESGIHPRGFYDQLKQRIFFAGGNYRVERPGIID